MKTKKNRFLVPILMILVAIGIGKADKGFAADCDPDDWFFCNPLRGSVETIAQAGEVMLGYILGLIGSVSLLFIIIAGIMYMTSAGNEERISLSKRILSGSVIGLMIALLAYGLLHIIMTVLGM